MLTLPLELSLFLDEGLWGSEDILPCGIKSPEQKTQSSSFALEIHV